MDLKWSPQLPLIDLSPFLGSLTHLGVSREPPPPEVLKGPKSARFYRVKEQLSDNNFDQFTSLYMLVYLLVTTISLELTGCQTCQQLRFLILIRIVCTYRIYIVKIIHICTGVIQIAWWSNIAFKISHQMRKSLCETKNCCCRFVNHKKERKAPSALMV